MLIKSEHYSTLKQAMQVKAVAMQAHKETLLCDGRIKDMEKRIRWDWLYMAISSQWICDNLYPYMNDTHIDTALKSIVRELEA